MEALSSALLSEVRFGSFLAYSPRGASEISKRSRLVCHRIKVDGVLGEPPVRVVDHAVRRLVEEASDALTRFLGPDVVLVPCPRSAPFPPGQSPTLWVPMRVCDALVRAGLGASVLPCLERVAAVPKSAFARPGDRPSPHEHIRTLRVKRALERSERLTVVDDVVTKGSTLLAATSLVAEAFPNAEVRAFALVRTVGLTPEVDRIVDPVEGLIVSTSTGDADRRP